jgi:hypothetical protein
MFGFFRRKKPAPPDPLAAFDAALEDLQREGATLRRSAATLLALRGELTRTLEKQRAQRASLSARLAEAIERGDGQVAQALQRDLGHLDAQIAANTDAQTKAEADSATLTETGLLLQQRQSDLEAERAGAQARLALGHVIEAALVAPQRSERLIALDAARDEIERAHALAEIYREEAAAKAG